MAGKLRGHMRSWFDGSGLLVGWGTVLLCVGVLTVLLELQSADVILWTGARVVGTEQGGIISYRWHGEAYSINGQGFGSSPAVTVYLDPANPSNAMPDSTVGRVLDGSIIVPPFLAGLALVVFGPLRNLRERRRIARGVVRPSGFGMGLDDDYLTRRLAELRRRGGR